MQEQFLTREFSESEVKQKYSKIVWFYDFWSLLTESKAAKKVIDLAAIQDGENILEVAVGTGLVFKEIVKRNPSGMNTGIELTPQMLFRAKKRVQKFTNNNYLLETSNAYKLVQKDNSFDLVVNNFMMDLMPEKDFETILSELYKVLKPKGRLVISTMHFGDNPYHKFWYWVAKKFPDILTGCRPVSLVEAIENSGFEVKTVIRISQNTFPAEVILAVK